jgi:hypothetical protein
MSEWKKYNLGVPLRVGLSAASPRCGRASLAAGFPLLSLTQKNLNHDSLDFLDYQDFNSKKSNLSLNHIKQSTDK